ncbi:hypothetical protein RHSIM_Rhsim03G0142900 [Rhododendron simsii]|uniref:1,3-beta-glucan synthase n=1 Tax=Rhododendron simsii TaxID=118357 RepID=A0A834H860_RHOSS|nr:hypothetical protein RHSIM_Rhsim03G0142900 [Rhododendron simsii]
MGLSYSISAHTAIHSFVLEKNKADAARFSPFWNEIIKNLREKKIMLQLHECCKFLLLERVLLLMPRNTGNLLLVRWPLFLLASKSRDSQEKLWDRISRDDYMKYAVEECYCAVRLVLTAILDDEGKMWVEKIYERIEASIAKRTSLLDFHVDKLALVISRVTALMGIEKEAEKPDLHNGAVKAIQDLYNVVHHDVLSVNMREHYETWNILSKARNEGRLFSNLKWPQDVALVKRLYSILTIKDSAANVPRNLEARRRFEFFTNSLFMNMPLLNRFVTPYYSEVVLYGLAELQKKNEDGISILFYLQKIYPDEWRNFLAWIGRNENLVDSELFDSPSDILKLRFWASYRGQTLARTDMEAAVSSKDAPNTQGFELSLEARAHADLKFTYVVTCQIYGKQKEENKPEAADIALLMQRQDGRVHTEYYSKLVKADISGKDKEIYIIKLPGNPKLGEGKPENQNHAVIFTRGNAVQTTDMNQDNYFEEALKMRNLLEELHCDRGILPATILGVRDHCFTESVSSLVSFMSNQESSFVTLGQRVLAKPLKALSPLVSDHGLFDTVWEVDGTSWSNSLTSEVNPDRALLTCVQLTVLTVYIFLYGKACLALAGVGEDVQSRAKVLDNAALNAQFLFQIGIFIAMAMILGFILEQGFLRALVSFATIQLQLCTVFFTFSLGTRTHYFGRTILHGGARYQATGKGFVVRHIRFAENYRLLEVVLLLVVYLAYGYNQGGALSYILLSLSGWFMALSWLFAPYLFNPSGFEWQKTVEDFRDWTNWLLYREFQAVLHFDHRRRFGWKWRCCYRLFRIVVGAVFCYHLPLQPVAASLPKLVKSFGQIVLGGAFIKSLGRGKRTRGNKKREEKHMDVVHVRARRGQATYSHSLAERVLQSCFRVILLHHCPSLSYSKLVFTLCLKPRKGLINEAGGNDGVHGGIARICVMGVVKDGKRLVLDYGDVKVVGTVEVGRAPTKIKTDLKKHIVNPACDPHLPLLYVAYADGLIRAYNIHTCAVHYTLQLDNTIKLLSAGAFAFHPTLEWIFVGDRRGTLLAWDASTERPNMIGMYVFNTMPLLLRMNCCVFLLLR